jgi:hypothetical protein
MSDQYFPLCITVGVVIGYTFIQITAEWLYFPGGKARL